MNPPMGARIVFRETAEDTHGDLLRFDFFLEPHRLVAEEHVHPMQEERFEIVAGTMSGHVGSESRSAGPGQVVVVPAGQRHSWRNVSDEEAHLVVDFRPALRTETFFETVFGLAREGKSDERGLPNKLQMSVLLAEYGDEFYPAHLPAPVRRALVLALAPVARCLGYRASYPQHTRSA